jgi:hypothetical protein
VFDPRTTGRFGTALLSNPIRWASPGKVFTRNNVFDKNSFEHLNVTVSVKRYRALFMDALRNLK